MAMIINQQECEPYVALVVARHLCNSSFWKGEQVTGCGGKQTKQCFILSGFVMVEISPEYSFWTKNLIWWLQIKLQILGSKMNHDVNKCGSVLVALTTKISVICGESQVGLKLNNEMMKAG